MDELNCPFCGGKNREYIRAVGGEYVGLVFSRHGSVSPCVCLDCGIVYIPKKDCERIKRSDESNA